jgi:hypothetical protein
MTRLSSSVGRKMIYFSVRYSYVVASSFEQLSQGFVVELMFEPL